MNARRENRTPTPLRVRDFESRASTSSAIRAKQLCGFLHNRYLPKSKIRLKYPQ